MELVATAVIPWVKSTWGWKALKGKSEWPEQQTFPKGNHICSSWHAGLFSGGVRCKVQGNCLRRHTVTALGLYNEPRCEEALCSIYKSLYYWQGNLGGCLPKKTMRKERKVGFSLSCSSHKSSHSLKHDFLIFFPLCVTPSHILQV